MLIRAVEAITDLISRLSALCRASVLPISDKWPIRVRWLSHRQHIVAELVIVRNVDSLATAH